MASTLTPAQRIELADALYASVPQEYQADVEKTWEREIDRRLERTRYQIFGNKRRF